MSKILFFLLLLSSLANAQTLNQFDADGLRHGDWQGTYEKSNRLRYKGTFEHGKEIGVFTFYDDTKKANIVATRDFSVGKNSCLTTFFDENNFVVSNGLLLDKLPEGEWIYYHYKSKDPMTVEYYKNGKLEGLKKVFYKNGTLAETTLFKNGLKNGKYVKYAENGQLLEELFYLNDELHGEAIYHDGTGNINQKGQYKKGIRKGIWTVFENGKKVKTKDYNLVNPETYKLTKNEQGKDVPQSASPRKQE